MKKSYIPLHGHAFLFSTTKFLELYLCVNITFLSFSLKPILSIYFSHRFFQNKENRPLLTQYQIFALVLFYLNK